MEYFTIPTSNKKISKVCLGCMSFGEAGTMHDWTLDQDRSEEIIKYALDQGINFFDTANTYSKGTSEIYLGNILKKYVNREDVFIASKVYFNDGHLSKEAIFREIEGTLRRLQTDYLDLYIIHRFDYETPIIETMQALDTLVKQGKVRALGASAMYAYQFYNMQMVAKENSLTPFTFMENHYNLLYREDERDLIPVCQQMGVTLMPYSPLAAGHLARNTWDSDSLRSATDKTARAKYDHAKDNDLLIIKRVEELSQKYNCKMSEISLAWMYKKGVHSPIIGATKTKYIDDAVNALNIKLSDEDVKYLEEPYHAHDVVGAILHN